MKKIIQKLSSFFVEGGLKETVLRFPLSSFCALALTVIMILVIHDVIDAREPRIASVLTFGFFWFGGARLVSEGLAWPRFKEWILGFGIFIPIAALLFMADQFEQYLLFIIPATLLFLMVAPYVNKLRDPESDFSFWQYNFLLISGVLVSFLVIIVLTGGLNLAFYSVETLFGLDFSYRIMSDIWAISAILVGPIFALSRVPKVFHYDPVECQDPMGLRFILSWILAPLILIYFVILYAYLIKIIIMQEIPLGQLAYMVSGFAGVSVATYLVGWPMRDAAGSLIQKIYKYLFIGLAIPVGMQMVAIAERIYTFGITEQRYLVVLSAVWLAIIIAAFLFKKTASIKIIPTILSLLLIVAAFGPWGAVGLSGASQLNRLEGLLIKHEILKEGEVVKTTKEISFDDRKSITSKLQYLRRTERFATVEGWLGMKAGASDARSDKYKSIEDIAEQMGFQPVYNYQRQDQDNRFSFNHHNHKGLQDISGFDYSSKSRYARQFKEGQKPNNNKITPKEGDTYPEVSWTLKGNVLNIDVVGHGSATFDLATFTNEKINKYGLVQHGAKITDAEEAILTKKVGNMKIRLVITNISGKIEDEVPMVENLSFTMLLDL